jgi:hypothetical protein
MSSATSEKKVLLRNAEDLLTKAGLEQEDVAKIVVSLMKNTPLEDLEFMLEGEAAVANLKAWAGKTV